MVMFEFIRHISIDIGHGTARGSAEIPASHPLFQDHFPGSPVLPGSILIELCAQVAGLLAEETAKSQSPVERWAVLGMVRNASFLKAIELPATISISATIVKSETMSATVNVVAARDVEPDMRAELVMMLLHDLLRNEAAIKARNERFQEWSSAT
jgi:3-hydroxyacyl-[acyl-carrier-protein] dehydratase